MAGQFMAATGGMTPAIQEALQRRQGGMPQGATAAVGAGAPGFNPATQPPAAPTANVPGVPSAQPNPSVSQMPLPNGENDTIIIKALATKLNQKI